MALVWVFVLLQCLCPRYFPSSREEVHARVFYFHVVNFSSFLKVLAVQIFAAESRPVIIMMVIFLNRANEPGLNTLLQPRYPSPLQQSIVREKYPGSTCI